jgi:hypothetical protein
MHRYVYVFLYVIEDDEVFFRFPKFPEIISSISRDNFAVMRAQEIRNYVSDAVLTALQTRISARLEIPDGDNPHLAKGEGFVELTVQQAMKLELFAVYRENFRSVGDFSKQIGKPETALRRMLDMRHPSVPTEIEKVLEILGKRIVHMWDVEPTNSVIHSTRPLMAPKPPSESAGQSAGFF